MINERYREDANLFTDESQLLTAADQLVENHQMEIPGSFSQSAQFGGQQFTTQEPMSSPNDFTPFENASSIHPRHQHLASEQSLLSSEQHLAYGWSEGEPPTLRPSSKHNLAEMLLQQKHLV